MGNCFLTGNRQMRISNWVSFLAISALTSCGAPHQLIRVAPEKNDIKGVQSALDGHKKANVVFIHGVCYHDRKWVFGMNASLAQELGLSWKMNDSPTPIGTDGGELYVNELSGPAGVVRTFAIVWAPVATKVKKSLCYDSTETIRGVCEDPE